MIIRILASFLFCLIHLNVYSETFNVLFINGIQNDRKDAEKSAISLQSLLNASQNRHVGIDPYFVINKPKFIVTKFYNPLGFSYSNVEINNLQTNIDEYKEDLAELVKSKINEENYEKYYPQIYSPHDETKNLDVSAAEKMFGANSDEIFFFQDVINEAVKEAKIKSQNKKLIIVAHSQGNIIANYIWAAFVKEYGQNVHKKLRIVNVANTTIFSPNKLSLTHEGDGALKSLVVSGELGSAERNTDVCNGKCPFRVFPTYKIGSLVHSGHGFISTYMSNLDSVPLIAQGETRGQLGNTNMASRLEDLIYTAAESLDRANDTSEVTILAQLPLSISVREPPTLTGTISSEHPITSLTINYKLPDNGSIFDGNTLTLLGCPEAVFGDCTSFDENNNGEIDLSLFAFKPEQFSDLGEYPITIHAENSFGKKSSADFTVTVIPKANSVSVSPNPVDVGETFKLSVSGKKLTEDVKAYVVGGSECSIATPTNEVFVEFDCTAQSEGELTYVVYYKEQATELYKDTVLASIPSVCTEGQTDTQSCSAIANGTNIQTRSCLANGQWGAFESCSVSCNSGFHLAGATCIADDISVAGTENFQALGNTLSTNTTTLGTGEIYRSFYGINTETNSEHVLLQDGVQFVSIEGDVNLTDAQVTDNARARVALELKLKSESTDELATFFLAFDERVAGVKSRTYFTSSTTPNGDTVGGEIPIVGLHKIPLTKGTAIKYKIELINDGTNFARVWLDDVSTLLPLTFLPTNNFRFYQTHFMTYVKNANVGDFVKGTVDNIVLKYTENGVEKTAEQDFSSLADGRLPSAGDIFNRVEYVQTGTVQVCTPTATEIKSCSIVNGTGVQTRSCAIDGLSWLDYGTCEVQSCDSGYHEENGVCIETLVVSAPTNLQPLVGDSAVLLKWDDVPDATVYTVYWRNQTPVNSSEYTNFKSTHSRELLISNLTNNQTYYFTVVARNAEGVASDLSSVVTATPTASIFSLKRANVSSTGEQTSGTSSEPDISSDGNFVVFQSTDGNLVDNDTNGITDVFFHNITTGVTQCVSRCDLSTGPLRGNSVKPSVSNNGNFIAFQSSMEFPGIEGQAPFEGFALYESKGEDIFIFNRNTGGLQLANPPHNVDYSNGNSKNPSISGDGQFVVFESIASNLVPNDTNNLSDIFLFNRQTGELKRISIANDGTEGNGGSVNPVISKNGSFVVYHSSSSNLVVNNGNSTANTFVYDIENGVTEYLASTTGLTSGAISNISGDGRYIVFTSPEVLEERDTNQSSDIYIRDRNLEITELVSVSSGNEVGNNASVGVLGISANGRFVAFSSLASNFTANDTNSKYDVFLRDRALKTTQRMSNSSLGIEGDLHSLAGAKISSDGKKVIFTSRATNLVTDDTNEVDDIFIWSLIE